MSEIKKNCPECGVEIPPEALHCPGCLLARAVGNASDDSIEDGLETTSSFDRVPVTEEVGDTIGGYKLLEKIGEGGFGLVYMAKQERPVRRQVALKIIKLGMDTKQVVGRFEAERQALAMMEHPNIAKVLDAGSTESGRPYFVMELVHGVSITEFCNENRLTTEERLKLFVKVCHAVQHAHQKGIIHRDLKPSNILVTMHDDEAVPKVIDFGIAKATQHDLTDKTLFTQFRHFMGTPAYMSPEQAQMSGLGVDTRSDIYSLGVLLYELLTGQTPLDLREAQQSGYDELRRCIREEDPVKPSTRVSQLSGAARTTLSKQSRSKVGAIQGQLRGDLDWIVMRAIEKDRTRRYETANLFARDVELYLRDEPVSAAAPSAWYLLTKLARRHKPIVGSLAVALPLLFAAMVTSGWLFWKERKTTKVLLAERTERDQLNANLEQTVTELKSVVRREQLARYALDMGLAQSFIAARRIGNAETILERYRPDEPQDDDFREFCWYYLKHQCSQAVVNRVGEKGDVMLPKAFSPDGNWLVVEEGLECWIWDVRLKRKVSELKLPTREATGNRILRGGFSPDGGYLAVWEETFFGPLPKEGQEFAVMLWKVDGEQIESLPSTQFYAWPTELHGNMTQAVKFIPGTRLLAIQGNRETHQATENDVVIYDLESGRVVKTLSQAGTILDISPDGDVLITQRWRQDPPVSVFWDLATGKKLREEVGLTDRELRFFRSEELLITRNSGPMELRDRETLELLPLPDFPVNRVNRLRFSTDRQSFLLQESRHGATTYWNTETGQTMVFDNSTVLSPDDRWVAYFLDEGGVAVVPTSDNEGTNLMEGVGIGAPLFDGDEVIVRRSQGTSRAYRSPFLDSSRLLSHEKIVGSEGDGVYWTQDDSTEAGATLRLRRIGGVMATNEFESGEASGVRIHRLASDRLLCVYVSPLRMEIRDRKNLRVLHERRFSTGFTAYDRSALVPDANLYVFYGTNIESVVFASTETLETIEERSVGERLRGVTYLPTEKRLVAFYASGAVHEYSMPDRRLVHEYEIGAPILRADVSPNGRTIMVKRMRNGDAALELVCRESLSSMIMLPAQGGLRMRYVMFSGNEGLIAIYDNFNASKGNTLGWFAAPRED